MGYIYTPWFEYPQMKLTTFKNIALEWYKGKKDRWSVGYRDDMMDAFKKDVFPYIGYR